MEAMLEHKAILGGEQSGHIIFLDKGHTGDGLLTAVRLLDVVAGTGKELRELRAEAITEYPQILQNVRVGRGASLDDAGRPLGRGARRRDRTGSGGQGPGACLGHRAPDQGDGRGPFRRGGEALR